VLVPLYLGSFIMLPVNMSEVVHREICVVDTCLRMSGAIHLLPQYAAMVQTGTTLYREIGCY
jgi:hypothetical protein